MAKNPVNTNINQAISDFGSIKEAIVAKGVEVPKGTPTSDYDKKISAISGGSEPTGKITITENGENIDVAQYATADVAVPQGIMVDESYDISEGKLNTATVTLEGDVVARIPDGVVTLGGGAFSGNKIITNAIIPNSVTTIEDGAPWLSEQGCFYECENLKSIIISNTLTEIGNFAFNYCTSLTSITIPDSVTSIGSSAFSHCTSLTSITIPDSVTSIGSSAFDGCTSLTSITIPDSVTSIGDNAFSSCTSLTDIYYTGTQAEWEQISIGESAIPAGATIHYEYTPE